MSFEHANPPKVVIEIPLEQTPSVRIHCDTFEDEQRIRWWIGSRPELHELVDAAIRLADRERAA